MNVLLCATSLPHLPSEPLSPSHPTRRGRCRHATWASSWIFFLLQLFHVIPLFSPSPVCFSSLLPAPPPEAGLWCSWVSDNEVRTLLLLSPVLAPACEEQAVGLTLAPATTDNQRPLLSAQESFGFIVCVFRVIETMDWLGNPHGYNYVNIVMWITGSKLGMVLNWFIHIASHYICLWKQMAKDTVTA